MNFTKMHGLGNDFILIEPVGEALDYNEQAPGLCDRHTGIGADGLLLVLPSEIADVRMRVINADGSEAEMCGNGIRCFTRYVVDRGIVSSNSFTVETLAGIMAPNMIRGEDGVALVQVHMGVPDFERSHIPMTGPPGHVLRASIEVMGEPFEVTSLRMGVPHTMLFVEDVSKVDLPRLGPAIERHPFFPKRTNVNFVEVMGPKALRVRTWERGAGVTLACGTGSCAAVAAACALGLIDRQAEVHLARGILDIHWTPEGHITMTGPAEYVFQGTVA